VGFGLGDVAIRDLATEFGLLPANLGGTQTIFVIDAEPEFFSQVLSLVAQLRRRDFAAVYSYKRRSLVKQLKQAADRGAARVIIVDRDTGTRGVVGLKDLQSGVQRALPLGAVLDDPHQDLGAGA
jgi:histidyl-tRNA synthetase